MLRGEFKALTGLDIPESVFEVIHKDYMASKQDKEDYCAQFNDTLYLGTPHTIREVEPKKIIPIEINVSAIQARNIDDDYNVISGLGQVMLTCETNDERISLIITAISLDTDSPVVLVQECGAPWEDDTHDLTFSFFIELLESVKDEPLKSIAQFLLNDLTVRFADIIERGEQ